MTHKYNWIFALHAVDTSLVAAVVYSKFLSSYVTPARFIVEHHSDKDYLLYCIVECTL